MDTSQRALLYCAVFTAVWLAKRAQEFHPENNKILFALKMLLGFIIFLALVILTLISTAEIGMLATFMCMMLGVPLSLLIWVGVETLIKNAKEK